MKYIFISILFIQLLVTGALAQPDWTVSHNDFQHSMTITAILNIEGTESNDENDILGVFVKNECRGISKPTYVLSFDKHLLYTMIFSNINQGDTLTFKIYDASTDKIIPLNDSIIFTADLSIGTSDNPYIFKTPVAKADFLNFSFSEQVSPAEVDNKNQTIKIDIRTDSDITNLIASFTLSEGAKAYVNEIFQESGVISNDFSDTLKYTVVSSDEQNQKKWLVIVKRILNNEAKFLDFSVPNQIGESMINPDTKNIYINISGNDTDSLIANFSLSLNAKAYIGSTKQESGASYIYITTPVVYLIVSENEQSTEYWTITIAKPTGIGLSPNNEIKIYPTILKNSYFNIETIKSQTFEIYNTKSVLIKKGEIKSGKNKIHLKSSSQGLLFIRLTDNENHIKVYKVIK